MKNMFPNVNFGNYPNREKIRKEFILLKQKYPNLNVKMDYCESLPVLSNNQIIHVSFNFTISKKIHKADISLEIYIEYLYPLKPPTAFIKPTRKNKLELKPWKHIDKEGKLIIPYLVKWNEFTSNLLDFCVELQYLLERDFPFESSSTFSPHRADSPIKTVDIKEAREAAQNVVYGVNGIHTKLGYPSQFSTKLSNVSTTSDPNINQICIKPHIKPITKQLTNEKSVAVANKTLRQSQPNIAHIDDSTIEKYMDDLKLHKLRQEVQQKFYKVLGETVRFHNVNIDYLKHEKIELSNRNLQLTDLSKQLSDEINKTDIEIGREILKKNEMKQMLETLETYEREGIDADRTIFPKYPLYKQLFALCKEDQSIDDVLFILEHALSRRSIDSDIFLKKIRELSRRQFLVRATIEKCTNKQKTWQF